MTFSLHQGGVIVSSHAIHPLAHILDSCALIFSSCALFTIYPTSLQVITTRAREGGPKETGPSKNGHKVNSVTYVSGLSDLSRIVAQLPSSFLCCPMPPSRHPSSLTLVSLIPALHVRPSSTPLWPYGAHRFFQHVQTISILSDLIYSLTPFLFQLSYVQLHS